MKTLNRPMFRYGGPIKEGVMNGIREPKKNGGSMSPQFNTGLVGDERYPKTDGREHHVAFLAPLLGYGAAALRAAPSVYRGYKAARGPLKQAFSPGKQGTFGRIKDFFSPSGKFRDTTVPNIIRGKDGRILSEGSKLERQGILQSLKDPTRLGQAIRENPFTALSALTVPNMALSAAPVIGKGALGAGKMFIDAVLPGEQFRGGDENTEAAVLEKLTTKSIKEVLTPEEEKALAASKKATAEAAKIASASFAKAEKEKRIESYREIMDIKGMNRDATYKSLVDASKIIQEGGNLKEQLKSGKLISNLTQAASKRFDKVNQTEDAINSLILKGEIEKNIKQGEDGSQLKAAKDFAAENNVSVTQAYKDLGFSKNKDISENIAIATKSIGGTSTTTESVDLGVRMTYPELGIPMITKTDSELIELKKNNPLYKNASDAEIFEDLTVKAVRTGKELNDGVYIFGTSAFTITDGKLDQLR